MTLNLFSQIIITLFGGTAIYLMNRTEPRAQRWGVICGLIAQPWWYVQMGLHDQWAMLPVYLFYTYAWLSGFHRRWIRKDVPITT